MAKEERAEELKKRPVDLMFLDDHMPKYSRYIYEKTGLKVQDPGCGVGCGTYGCVYLTDDPRWVVKVTRDKNEGPMALRIVEIRKEMTGGDGFGPTTALQGLVFFKDVFRARPIWHHRKQFSPYILVRENVRPVKDKDVYHRMKWYTDKSVNDDPKPGLEIVQKWAERFHEESGDIVEAVEKYVEWLTVIREEFPLVVDDMLELMGEKYDLMLADVHAYNVGYTTTDWGSEYRGPGSVVVHDLGMTPANPDSSLPVLNPLQIIER